MTQSIPASQIVSIAPGVISAGGTGLTLSGLLLSNATRVPIGKVYSFANAAAVAAFFGASAIESSYASVYFNGFDNSQIKPAALLVAQYPSVAVSGYQRSGKITLTLAQLQAISAGTLTVATDGASHTTGSFSLSAATSFSNAATLITTALSSASIAAVCTWDSVLSAFVFTSPTTGASSTVAITSSALAVALNLTTATGLITSPGAAIAVPGTFMDGVVGQAQNWASFTTTFEPITADGLLFAAWTSGQNNRYAFVAWDTDTVPTAGGDTTSLGYQIGQAGYSGTILVWQATDTFKGPFVMGVIASVDFTQTDGRCTLAFKGQSGLTADVTDSTTATNLMASGYNFYGAFATAVQGFNFLYPGSVSGPFLWADSYIDEIYLNNAFQLAFMTLLTTMRSIPYNNQGYNLIRQAAQDPINAAVNAGVIRAGVTLSASQAAAVNAAAGLSIDTVISTRGWYLQVSPAAAIARAARTSPACTFWYTDGQSVQKINLSSLVIQ